MNSAAKPSAKCVPTESTGISDEDAEEQKELLEFFEAQKKKELEEKEAKAKQEKLQKEKEELEELEKKYTDVIEVEPGFSLPLRSSESTYRALLTGKTTSLTCFSCQDNLTTPSDVTMVICSACWICMPLENTGSEQEGAIGLGIKDEEIAKWMAKRGSSS